MPPDGDIGGFADLLQGFLDLVLAEVALAGVERGPDAVGPERLGDRDQGDFSRFTAGAAGSRADPFPDLPEVACDLVVGQVQRYLMYCLSMS